jgi:hypothetical protein
MPLWKIIKLKKWFNELVERFLSEQEQIFNLSDQTYSS